RPGGVPSPGKEGHGPHRGHSHRRAGKPPRAPRHQGPDFGAGPRPYRGERIRPAIGSASPAPGHPEIDRGSARRGNPARQDHGPFHAQGGTQRGSAHLHAFFDRGKKRQEGREGGRRDQTGGSETRGRERGLSLSDRLTLSVSWRRGLDPGVFFTSGRAGPRGLWFRLVPTPNQAPADPYPGHLSILFRFPTRKAFL